MNTQFTKVIVTVVLLMFAFTSCAPLPQKGTALTPEERESAKKSCIAQYTAIGALGGAVLGGLLGGKKTKTESAAIGAAAGGALAFALAYGHCFALFSDLASYPVAGYSETFQRIHYNPNQGSMVKIENFVLQPIAVSPGERIQLNSSYYVMSPENSNDIKVTETRTVYFYKKESNVWEELGSVPDEITAAQGTRKADGNIEIPANAPEGNYRIAFKVSALNKEDIVKQDITVKKGHTGS